MVTLTQTIPALPVRNAAAAVAFYRDRLGFDVLHHNASFAVLKRDEAEVHIWEAGDETWRDRASISEPVRSGAESFIAGTASCRVLVDEVDDLYGELRRQGVLHPVSRERIDETDYETREFAALDLDGNLLTFFARRDA
jgi:catechol 2,3-dioxygenase-like lactoylglutathione lyase family enzyme